MILAMPRSFRSGSVLGSTSSSLLVCTTVLVAALGGCAPVSTHYTGAKLEPVVHPNDVQDLQQRPPGSRALGLVEAKCHLENFDLDASAAAEPQVASERLSDLMCSPRLLSAALAERAAQVGGNALVQRYCVGNQSFGNHLRCTAHVVRTKGPSEPGSHFLDFPNGVPALASPSEAWRIKVHFSPSSRFQKRDPWPMHLVAEQSVVPVQDIELGDMVASCSEECADDSLRDALRVAASQVGGTDVAAIQCSHQAEGFRCVGTAAAPEVDPRRHSAAR
jgi:hypothetical protein